MEEDLRKDLPPSSPETGIAYFLFPGPQAVAPEFSSRAPIVVLNRQMCFEALVA